MLNGKHEPPAEHLNPRREWELAGNKKAQAV